MKTRSLVRQKRSSMINCIGFFFFSIIEHADVKKELKPRALCIDNIYVDVRLIKTLL